MLRATLWHVNGINVQFFILINKTAYLLPHLASDLKFSMLQGKEYEQGIFFLFFKSPWLAFGVLGYMATYFIY